MNGCVYRTSDDKCEFYSDYGKSIVSYCDFADCEDKKPSNADRIRQMTDEELAEWMYDHMACRYCPCMPCVSSDDIDEEGNIKCTPCEQILLDWLRKETEWKHQK